MCFYHSFLGKNNEVRLDMRAKEVLRLQEGNQSVCLAESTDDLLMFHIFIIISFFQRHEKKIILLNYYIRTVVVHSCIIYYPLFQNIFSSVFRLIY